MNDANNQKAVVAVNQYDRLDGRDAYTSKNRRLTLGQASAATDRHATIVAKLWAETEQLVQQEQTEHQDKKDQQQQKKQELQCTSQLALHQVLDMAILSCQVLEYMQEAYRYPKLYDEAAPEMGTIGLQGSAMKLEICTDNPNLDQDIQHLMTRISEDGEMIGERLRILARLLKEMGY